MAEGKGITLREQLESGVLLGNKGFGENLRSYLEEKLADKEIPKNQCLVVRPSLEEIFSKAREGKATRNALIYQAVKDYGYTLKEVGEFLGLHYSTVGKAFIKGGGITKFEIWLRRVWIHRLLSGVWHKLSPLTLLGGTPLFSPFYYPVSLSIMRKQNKT